MPAGGVQLADVIVSWRFQKIFACPGSPDIRRNSIPRAHGWDELREKEFPNRVFGSMKGGVSQLEAGLPRMAASTQALRNLPAWPWIVSLNLKPNLE